MSMIGFFVSIVLTRPEIFNLCSKDDALCINDYIMNFNDFAEIVGIFSITLFVIFVILLFFQEVVFNLWKKFAMVYIPIAMLIVFFSSNQSGVVPLSPKEFFIYLLPLSFFITSIIIVIKYFQNLGLWSIISIGHILSLFLLVCIAAIF